LHARCLIETKRTPRRASLQSPQLYREQRKDRVSAKVIENF
jgi:hypothetical protein